MDFNEFGNSVKNAAETFAAEASKFGAEVSSSVGDVGDDVLRYKRYVECGRDLFACHAITSHGGNISESDGINIWITRTNCMLGRLGTSDIVETTWEYGPADQYASRELVVHRAMHHGYLQRNASVAGEGVGVIDGKQGLRAAIIHAHPRHTIARSLLSDVLVPRDSEGLFTLGSSGIKVYAPAVTIQSEEAANMLGQAVFDGASIAVIKGHGPFAIAPTLSEALRLITCLEASCEICDILDMQK